MRDVRTSIRNYCDVKSMHMWPKLAIVHSIDVHIRFQIYGIGIQLDNESFQLSYQLYLFNQVYFSM